jgi:hypothetical protein
MGVDSAPRLAEFHNVSRRHCVFEDDGRSAWLYLTEPAGDESTYAPIAGDAFLFNHADPVEPAFVKACARRGEQPPISIGLATSDAVCQQPSRWNWLLLWSDDGESVAVLRNSEPIAFIRRGEKHGYCKAVAKRGAFGHPWSQCLFDKEFSTRP